jgi:hypothetical protein
VLRPQDTVAIGLAAVGLFVAEFWAIVACRFGLWHPVTIVALLLALAFGGLAVLMVRAR